MAALYVQPASHARRPAAGRSAAQLDRGRLSATSSEPGAYDRARHPGVRALRIKEWDYYCVTSGGDTVLALTIADNSYMGLDSVCLLDCGHGLAAHAQLHAGLMPHGANGPARLPAAKGDVSPWSGPDYCPAL